MADRTTRSVASFRSTRSQPKATKESFQKTLRMQQTQIDLLKKENDELRQKYEFESRIPPSTKPRSVQFRELQQLEQQGVITQRKIEDAKAENEELKNEINQLSRAVAEKRKEVRGVTSTKESDNALALQIRTLENRLDQALLRYNQAITENKQLREKIDSMRCERVIFDGVHKKMEKKLFEKKKQMADIIEEANVCYEERAAADQEKKSIQEQQREDRAYFEHESQQLDQEIEKCDQLSDFFHVGGNEDGSPEEDADLSSGVIVTSQEQAISQVSQEKMAAYEEALWRIKNATGIDSVDELVTRYLEVEDQIVTNNNIVGDLEVQIQRLEKEEREDLEKANELRETAAKRKGESGKLKDETQRQIEVTKKRIESFKQQKDDVLSHISILYAPVMRLFQSAQCDAPDEANAEGTITQTNIVSYLGQIEQKANGLRSTFFAAYPQLLTMSSSTKSRTTTHEYANTSNVGRTPSPRLSDTPDSKRQSQKEEQENEEGEEELEQKNEGEEQEQEHFDQDESYQGKEEEAGDGEYNEGRGEEEEQQNSDFGYEEEEGQQSVQQE
ncbi:putative flagellar outer dynein arm-docking complex protein 1 [Monocercomonoides exilis]|uniref:putative flagellar outer dynein arm-docking complex protein 1 n=1 Tax=Monocercomonoides exilis TaxID=2049356 RepID=UPI00355A1570|nr:putative flagellar outer dynein arm-docking complex protein 1 [Monocercomonoides exilis]|eukprot:MONOS_1336.1-p1 / transcript=MONOS_1336.1 / gene=MONOS_1336 / organism=Monocercomonoides_exilis_PA203 / gene_product=flagellar outer dynein arm-docking complex protein 1 / transcript_product=flagellar outer dynein arm-docking complex protein 1 / location=Mono_scaffold00023:43483-45428(+) / protein_length=560 / sequence_SO=supercontig / SO=protein_coding / is_pseudo=false